jgi:cell division protein FtsB
MPKARRQQPPARRRTRLWIIALVGLCLIGFLYYRPVKAYISTSHALSDRKAEVRALARQRAALERRLSLSATGQTLLEEARRLGYVRPGEHLFIVRGVEKWIKAHRHLPKQLLDR